MTDPQIIIAIIGAASVVMSALIAAIAMVISSRNERRELRRRIDLVAQDARAVRHQTQNTHETNLRDDVDMVLRTVARVEDNQHETRRDVARLHNDFRELRDHVTNTDTDNEQVHQTIFERLGITQTKDK